jgi:hypothetical protein
MAVNLLLCTPDEYLFGQLKLLLGEDVRTFSVYAFSAPGRARDYLAQNPGRIQCVLADPAFLAELTGPAVKVELGDETRMDPDAPLSLNVCQRKQDVLEDLHQVLRAAQLLSGGSRTAGSVKVFSFFSTQGGAGTSTLAYLTALKASETGKAVYLDLEAAPCTAPLYADEAERSAEEFLCAVKDRGDPGRTLLPALHRNAHGVYVFPLPLSLADQRSLSAEDVRYILDGLTALGEAQVVVADLSGAPGERSDSVMAASDRVVLVYGDDAMGRAKQERFLGDPAFASYPCAGREFLAGNRCRQNYTDGRCDVCFPHSESLAAGTDVQTVLRSNPAFARGCETILQMG